jgi:hypothetical protein
MAKGWIKKAIKHPGALTRMAKRKKMSISAFCGQSKLSSLAKKR